MPGRLNIPPDKQGPWIAALVVASVVSVGWLLTRWPGDHHWLTTILTYSPQAAWLLPPIGALAWAAAVRCWPAAALDTAVLVFALLGPGGVLLSHGAPPAEVDIHIATQNLFSLIEPADRFALDQWRRCDIVCLQETASDGYAELLPEYEQRTLDDLRTFVRGRIIDSAVVIPQTHRLPGALACEVDIKGHRLIVLNVHLDMAQPEMDFAYVRRLWPDYLRHTLRVREMQFDAWARWVDAQTLPVIVAGDFNTPPASRFYRLMRSRLTDCFAAVGAGGGYTWVPHGIPTFRIDYIWAGAELRPIECRVGHPGPSDHRLLVATLRLESPSARDVRTGSRHPDVTH